MKTCHTGRGRLLVKLWDQVLEDVEERGNQRISSGIWLAKSVVETLPSIDTLVLSPGCLELPRSTLVSVHSSCIR